METRKHICKQTDRDGEKWCSAKRINFGYAAMSSSVEANYSGLYNLRSQVES